MSDLLLLPASGSHNAIEHHGRGVQQRLPITWRLSCLLRTSLVGHVMHVELIEAIRYLGLLLRYEAHVYQRSLLLPGQQKKATTAKKDCK